MATAPAGVAAVLSPLCGRDFLSSADCSANETAALLDLAAQLKSGDRRIDLGNRVLGLIFSKASTRTRVSFQAGMTQLGGDCVFLGQEAGWGVRESMKDFGEVLSEYVDAIACRSYLHQTVQELTQYCTVPVINALTDFCHPCQALADVHTIAEHVGGLQSLAGQEVAYICLLYTSPSPRDLSTSRMPSSA